MPPPDAIPASDIPASDIAASDIAASDIPASMAHPSWPATWCVAVIAMAVSIAVRITSLSESLWVDELHSAWCIWDSLGDVVARSRAGNQSPVYFLFLWFWKLVIGQSEFALRMSSVLAVALGGGIATVGVTRWTGSLAAGLASGLVLALEKNAIFFGTELRPFAAVMLFACVATIGFVLFQSAPDRRQQRRGWTWMSVGILAAMVCQPTSAGVLGWFFVAAIGIWFFTPKDRDSVARQPNEDESIEAGQGRAVRIRTLVCIAIATVGIAAVLWSFTLQHSWQNRQIWASFATATHLNQLWRTWDWPWLVMFPMLLALAAKRVIPPGRALPVGARATRTSRATRALPIPRIGTTVWILAAIAVIATSGYWWVSWSGWLPLWHRRYYVAALPIMAIAAGGGVGAASSRGQCWGWIAAIAMLTGLTYHQGTLGRWIQHPTAANAARGEDWRGAAQWVNQQLGIHQERPTEQPPVATWLDSGLIEARTIAVEDATEAQRQYLAYPLRGPYPLAVPPQPIGRDINDWPRENAFLITRRRLGPSDRAKFPGSEVVQFGGVTVMRLPKGD
ncbi:hypothetical protein K227x_09460 [Rubripirellula lacrimiformis]|uniref:Glycosyltransferase RgtA/B/C/D-like domain-containing protein n=1 Tax=Rubripirellula lacrimiformis TaxID=1930273 RepID=A0A517N6D5_9BACT|nr:hypothetical protein [Rubripirellula lacrimiformis]QDT02568.1 hypothetical protein K227x_09460 [Rubripirellula lacrimiformis]